MLNHDASFLAELLHSLKPLAGGDPEAWSAAYLSWNCMRLPAGPEMPLLLRYVAASNVLLGEFKVRDHEADSGRRHWTWVRRCFNSAFRKARTDLADLGFPVADAEAVLARQSHLEAITGIDAERAAEPTAQVTAMVFRRGAELAAMDRPTVDAFADLGNRFGRLIYLIDAWEDFHRDARTGAFNPLRTSGAGRDWAAQRIREHAKAIAVELESLGAPGEFRSRLVGNIEAKLGPRLHILHSCARQARPTMRTRWLEAVGRARGWRAPLLTFTAVAIVAFIFPRHARLAKSAPECLSLAMNLMAIGGLLALAAEPEPHRKNRKWCTSMEGCVPDCCCCCDGCPDACCSCDACGADGCGECCSGCGNSCDCCSCCDCS